MRQTESQLIKETTDNYLLSLDPDNLPNIETIVSELYHKTVLVFDAVNSVSGKENKHKIPKNLFPSQIASVMMTMHTICQISFVAESASSKTFHLAVYEDEGKNAGLYVIDKDKIDGIARLYNFNISIRELAEVRATLKSLAPKKYRCMDPDLIPVNNGIFNYRTKDLVHFDPRYIFTCKCRVNYVPNPKNPVISNPDGTRWDVDTWVDELFDDPERSHLIWELLGAVLRPFVNWKKSAWFYSESGNNGKGTLCVLMRNLCGNSASIPLADFGKEFMLERLTDSQAVIVDENDVGIYIDKVGNLKAAITHDVIRINRKHKEVIYCQYYGFIVQCLNEFPRIKDKSESFYRRQLFVPFDKCFTGMERDYIRDDYLNRPEVLEYVLNKVLNMNYYKLSEPAACKVVLAEYKNYNDPVREFMEEFADRFAWDFLPFAFVYDLYKAWLQEASPSGQPLGKTTFTKDLLNISHQYGWCCEDNDKTKKVAVGNKMDKPEYLIGEYSLVKWENQFYKGSNLDGKYITHRVKAYDRGLVRMVPVAGVTADDGCSEDDIVSPSGISYTGSGVPYVPER